MSRKNQSLLISNSVLSIKPVRRRTRAKNTFGTPLLKRKPIVRVGKTSNFVVDYDSTERLILVYGKEAPISHGFKLGLDKNEATALINLLKRALSSK